MFQAILQERSNWCWAACLQMCIVNVPRANPRGADAPTQCALATTLLNNPAATCCLLPPLQFAQDPRDPMGYCNVPLEGAHISGLFAQFGFEAQVLPTSGVAAIEQALQIGSPALGLVNFGEEHYLLILSHAQNGHYEVANPNPDVGLTTYPAPMLGDALQYCWSIAAH